MTFGVIPSAMGPAASFIGGGGLGALALLLAGWSTGRAGELRNDGYRAEMYSSRYWMWKLCSFVWNRTRSPMDTMPFKVSSATTGR